MYWLEDFQVTKRSKTPKKSKNGSANGVVVVVLVVSALAAHSQNCIEPILCFISTNEYEHIMIWKKKRFVRKKITWD